MSDRTGDYEATIRRLPPPTLAQTERFARYTSRAHSWYKHLRIRPKVPFVFFLDPGAGKRRVHTDAGEVALVDISDDSPRFHYTRMTTQEYRRRFGYWNYHAPYGTSFLFAGEGGVVSTEGPGLKILRDAGGWARVPRDLIEAGTAHVSAVAYGYSPSAISIWASHPDGFGLGEIGDARRAEQQPTWEEALHSLSRVLREECSGPPLRERLPPLALESLQTLLAGAPRMLGSDWPDEGWLDHLRSSGSYRNGSP
jgi:hypothetical protein